MSNVVFNPPPSLGWSVFKSPEMSTIVQPAASGKTTRASLWAQPLWHFKLTWELLRDGNASPSNFQALVDFFLARRGSFDTFLYTDPTDHQVTDMSFGLGDGVATSFQLVRTWSAFSEAIQNLNGAPVVKDNGVTKTAGVDYSVDNFGVVAFAVAPVAGHALTWTGQYYYRLRFKQDLQEFENFMFNLWALKTLELVSEKL